MDLISEYYPLIIVVLFVMFAVAEMFVPLTRSNGRVTFRWFTNFSMTLSIVLMYKLGGPVLAILTAAAAEYLELGLFNNIGLSMPLVFLLGIVALDLKQYWFHRLVHYFDALWLVHQVHHSDVEIDVTTGFRFHPLEAILSALIDIVMIAVLGISAEVLLLRYLLIFFFNFFSHCNIYIPPTLDRYLQWVLVTPSMHHLHHALDIRASNQNFGVFLSIWDRIFGTYMSEHPETGQQLDQKSMVYGLRDYRDPGKLNLGLLLLMPFKRSQASQEEPTGP